MPMGFFNSPTSSHVFSGLLARNGSVLPCNATEVSIRTIPAVLFTHSSRLNPESHLHPDRTMSRHMVSPKPLDTVFANSFRTFGDEVLKALSLMMPMQRFAGTGSPMPARTCGPGTMENRITPERKSGKKGGYKDGWDTKPVP